MSKAKLSAQSHRGLECEKLLGPSEVQPTRTRRAGGAEGCCLLASVTDHLACVCLALALDLSGRGSHGFHV